MPPPKAGEAFKPDVKQLPFTKATRAVIGLAVLACNTVRSGLEEAAPAVVTRIYPNQPNKADIETFFPHSHSFAHAHPVAHATVCFNEADVNEALKRGDKWLCYPYDPMDPKPYVPKKAEPAASAK